MKELPKVYDPRDVESRIYQMWMDGDCTWATPWTAPYRTS